VLFQYAISPDGNRFLISSMPSAGAVPPDGADELTSNPGPSFLLCRSTWRFRKLARKATGVQHGKVETVIVTEPPRRVESWSSKLLASGLANWH